MKRFSYLHASEYYRKNSFIEAVKSADIPLMKNLLLEGADIEAQDSFGRTPLIFASLFNIVDSVNFLLENVADTETKDEDQETALIYAVRNACVEAVEVLLIYGADIHATNNRVFDINRMDLLQEIVKNEKILEMFNNPTLYKLRKKLEPSMTKAVKNSNIF
jgi:ankyrin repeat protein